MQLLRFLVMRILAALPVLLVLSVVTFAIIQAPPGDYGDYIRSMLINQGGATMEACGRPSWRAAAWLTLIPFTSGGGATTEVDPPGAMNRERPVAASGTAGSAVFDATKSGRAGAPSLIVGSLAFPSACAAGTRMVWRVTSCCAEP